ncbi:MAG: DUF3099 domain-containing protein [Nocardioidaceae bacterium]|nr:DUF3099 domain-containing protein [Nocardioidaceae bacterium]
MNQQDNPVAITSVRPARSVDIRRRQTRYLLSMGVRTICFVLAIVTTGPLRWFFVAGAVILPYIAVVLANATDHRGSTGPIPYVADQKPQIEGPKPATGPLP